MSWDLIVVCLVNQVSYCGFGYNAYGNIPNGSVPNPFM